MKYHGQKIGLAFTNGLKQYVQHARTIGSAYVSAFIGGASSLGLSIYNSGVLPVGHSWHGLACPGIQAERSYSVERERACRELSIPILRGQSSRHHRDSWRQVSVLDQTSKQVQKPQARGRRGILPKPNKVKPWATSPQRFLGCVSWTSSITSPGDVLHMEILGPLPGPGVGAQQSMKPALQGMLVPASV